MRQIFEQALLKLRQFYHNRCKKINIIIFVFANNLQKKLCIAKKYHLILASMIVVQSMQALVEEKWQALF